MIHRLLCLVCVAAGLAAAEYRLPARWTEPDGNPVHIDGRPRWRLDRIWPENAMAWAGYEAMIWRDGRWVTDTGTFGGQPAAQMAGSSILRTDVRGPWSGQEGRKSCALIFIAPAKGTYAVAGTVAIERWAGDGEPTFTIARRLTAERKMRAVRLVPVAVGADTDIVATAELAAGDELALIGEMPAWHSAAAFTFRDLRITGP